MLIKVFCSVFCLAFLLINFAFAETVPVKDLSGSLTGAQIIRILPVKNVEDEAHIDRLRSFFVDTFEQGYAYLFENVFKPKGLSRGDLRQRFEDAFNESTTALKEDGSVQNFFFLEAIDLESNRTVGTASFKKLENPKQVYLFNFAASYFRKKEQRGIGRQLLKAIAELVPNVDTVHLVVRKQHSKAIAIYKHWGFVESTYVDPIYPKDDFPGMTLKGEAFSRFLAP
jgi:ribosomal protein S18 acetylase RimI-like enzyme